MMINLENDLIKKEGGDKELGIPNMKKHIRIPITELALESENLKLINGENGPSKRGIAAKQKLDMLHSIKIFRPELKTINSLPLESCNDSCKNICQNCFVTNNTGSENEAQEFVGYGKIDHENSYTKISSNASTNMVFCKWCRIYKYCNQACYDAHWLQIHQYECRVFSQLLSISQDKSALPEIIRHGIRLYCLCELDHNYRSRVLDLTSHSSIINLDTEYVWLHTYTNSIVKAIDLNMNFNLYSYIWELMCISIVNSSVLMNEYQEAVGINFDPDFSLLNHSCIPNTLAIPLNNFEFSIVTTFSVDENKELFTNYCFTSCPKELRNSELKKRFYFTCSCNLCKQKIDWFFSYNCPNCNMLLCGLSFDNFFSKDLTAGLLLKEDRMVDFCSNCGKFINKEHLKESRTCHQQLLAMMFYDIYNANLTYNLDNDSMNSEKLKEEVDNFMVEKSIINFSGSELIEYIESLQLATYRVSSNMLGIIESNIKILRKQKIVPSYCFPLNHIITGFNEHDIVSSLGTSKNDKDFHIQCLAMKLKMDLQTYFEVKIPGDLTDLKISTMIYMKDISHQLLTLAEVVIKYSIKSSVLCEWIKDEEKLIETLIKCASFFNLQAIDAYLPFSTISKSYEMLSQLIDVGIQIKSLSMSDQIENIPKALFLWYSNSPSKFNDEMFVSCLKDLFTFADSSIVYKRSAFKLQFADRNRKVVFKPVQKLASKDMKCLQVANVKYVK